MYLRLLIITLFIFISCSEKNEDKPLINVAEKIEASALEGKALSDMISHYTEKISSQSELDTNDFIALVKMYNTIAFYKLWHIDTVYGNFSKLYFSNINKKSREILGAEKNEQGLWYSKKYDIFIGNPEHEKSRFVISDLKQ